MALPESAEEFRRGPQITRGTPHELSQYAYIQFLRVVNDRFALGNPVGRPLRLQKAEEILREADALSIGRQHPVVLVTLRCLYGNSSARKVMKFKADPARFDAENALADIMIISRFLPRKLEIEQLGREGKASFLRTDFITDDDGLASILRCFEGEFCKIGFEGGRASDADERHGEFRIAIPRTASFHRRRGGPNRRAGTVGA